MFDEWIIGCFNFVSTWPILFLGFFDRDLERDYTKRNPHLYAAGPANESLCLRATLRWAMLVGVHALIIYFFSNGILGGVGAGMSSAFKGLMHNKSVHGDGEGDNIQVYGTLIFVCLNWILAIKVSIYFFLNKWLVPNVYLYFNTNIKFLFSQCTILGLVRI